MRELAPVSYGAISPLTSASVQEAVATSRFSG